MDSVDHNYRETLPSGDYLLHSSNLVINDQHCKKKLLCHFRYLGCFFFFLCVSHLQSVGSIFMYIHFDYDCNMCGKNMPSTIVSTLEDLHNTFLLYSLVVAELQMLMVNEQSYFLMLKISSMIFNSVG